MRRTLEAIFRRPLQLLMLLVLLPILGVAVMYFIVPRTYASTASLWALQRYFIVTSTGAQSNLLQTEAGTQTTALNELLQTRSFVDAVVKGINLAPTLGLGPDVMNNPQELESALFNEISSPKNVVVTPSDEYLFTISYTNRDPRIAQQIVASIITNFGKQGLELSVTEGENLLASYQTQLALAQKMLNDSVTAETQYARAHPNQTPNQLLANDSQYAFLDTKKTQAQTTVQGLQSTINTIQQTINTQGTQTATLYRVVDAPLLPFIPVSRKKEYIIGGGLGLVIALLASVLYLLIVVRRDRGVYSAYDLQDIVAFPVIMQLPHLTTSTMSLLIPNSKHGQALLTSGKSSSNGHLHRS